MNNLIFVKEIVFKIKILSTKKTQGFTGKLFLTFKERNIPRSIIFFRL